MKWKRLFTRKYSVQYCEVALHSIGKRVAHLMPTYMERQIITPDNKNECCYFEEEEAQRVMADLIERFATSKEHFKRFVKLFYQLGNTYVACAQKIEKQKLETQSTEKLKQLYVTYQKRLLEYTCVLWIGCF